jgi:hypothetical protein
MTICSFPFLSEVVDSEMSVDSESSSEQDESNLDFSLAFDDLFFRFLCKTDPRTSHDDSRLNILKKFCIRYGVTQTPDKTHFGVPSAAKVVEEGKRWSFRFGTMWRSMKRSEFEDSIFFAQFLISNPHDRNLFPFLQDRDVVLSTDLNKTTFSHSTFGRESLVKRSLLHYGSLLRVVGKKSTTSKAFSEQTATGYMGCVFSYLSFVWV